MTSKLSRRSLLNVLLSSAALGVTSACSTSNPSAKVSNQIGLKSQIIDNPGVQLYSVRESLKQASGDTFHRLAGMGYKHAEWFDVTALDVLAGEAQSEGLVISSCHVLSPFISGDDQLLKSHGVSLPEAFNSPEKLIDKLNHYGIKNVVLSYLFEIERENLSQYQRLSEQLNKVGELCSSAGIQLCYHNHEFEFMKLDGMVPFELLRSELDPKWVKFELDVFWLAYAGLNPVEIIHSLKDRCGLLHLKDFKPIPKNSVDEPPKVEQFKPLGQGVIDFYEVIAAADMAGVGLGFVEQDSTAGDIFKDLEASIHYLKSLA
jgi:sugar phosphate isomerase/epimerase